MLGHFKSFQLVYFSSVLFGVMPFHLRKRNSENQKPSINRVAIFMSVFWISVILITNLTCIILPDLMFNVHQTLDNKKQLTMEFVSGMEYWIRNGVVVFNILFGIRQMKKLPNLISNILFVETTIAKFFDRTQIQLMHKKELLLSNCLVFLCFIITIVATIITYKCNTSIYSVLSCYVQLIIENLTKVIMFSVELQFSLLCIYIFNRMKLINQLFSCSFLQNKHNPYIIEVKPRHPIQRFSKYITGEFDQIFNNEHKLRILILIKENHDALYSVGEQIRQMYQVQMMLSVGEVFFKITNDIYITVKMFKPGEISYIDSAVNLASALQEIIRVVLFTMAAGITSDEINKTLWYASSIETHKMDVRMKHQIKCFNLHLNHEKFKFCLCDMFTINTTFLAAITVGIVNSLILSLQYKYSDKQSLSTSSKR